MLYPHSRGSGPCHIFGRSETFDPSTAALHNALSAHILELDDGSRFGMMHPGVPIVSALLAACHMYGFGETEFLKGMIVGYEAALVIAEQVQPDHKERGFHTTGTLGVVGAALAVAYALNMTTSEKKTALSAALTGSSGLLAAIDGESELKPLNAARSA